MEDPRSGNGRRPERGPSARLRAVWPHLTASAVSGLLLYLSFPPFDLGPAAFVALVPLLVAVGRAPGYVTAAVCGWLALLVAGLGGFAWLASVAVPGWLGLALYVSLYGALAALSIRWMREHLPAAWPATAACAWVALELVRAELGPGFPWLFIGYTQYRATWLVQTAALGGVYAVGFVVFLTNAALAAVAERMSALRRAEGLGPGACRAAILGVAVLGLACVGGAVACRRVEMRQGPRVGVVQQNIPRLMSEIFDPDKTAADYYRERRDEVQLCAQLTARMRERGLDLAVWPESTAPVPLDLPPAAFAIPEERRLHGQTMGYLRELGEDMGCHFLIGAPSYVSREAARSLLYGVSATPQFANSAVFLSPGGQVLDRYDKMRLVPFGEYVPGRALLPFLAALTPIPREITPGRQEVIFTLPDGAGTRFGALVCYEDVFPDLCIEFRRRGAQFLVNLTDEGWYLIAGELRQHLAMAVFRAVETRTTVVRCANTGISCFIDPRGEVYAALKPWTQGTLSAPVRLSDRVTPYVRFGDAFAVACLMLTIAAPGLRLALRREGRTPHCR
ncbi:MAG: apolipoprotein N-acyltransferase [Candidatus Brocadiaceae bacterium]|nr:apolipoprotein N-acyltransferase [Candidatus Brocadiaceae bacterium]